MTFHARHGKACAPDATCAERSSTIRALRQPEPQPCPTYRASSATSSTRCGSDPIAALCDITIASEAATFQIPEMEHYILPTMVLSAMIDRMTRKGLGYMTWSCATVGPERALSHGIVSEVVPAAKLDQAVEDLCKFMLKAPAVATGGVKEYLRHAMTMDVPSAVDLARNLHAVVNSSSEMKRPK